MTDIELLRLPFAEARKWKFEKGRAEHGPIFLKDPLAEAYQECIDACNYMDEAYNRGGHCRHSLNMLQGTFEQCAEAIKHMVEKDGLIDHAGNKTYL